MVAAVVYLLVPPFVPVLGRLGDDMPLSAHMLVAAYPFAVVLPLAYAAGAGVLVFLLLALYVPMFELS